MPMTTEDKLKAFGWLNASLNKSLTEKKVLPRSDWWRKAYYEDPYLAHAPDDYIIRRFVDVFNNVSSLTERGQIGLLPIGNGGEFFMSRFTHLLEEQNYRPGVIQSANLKEAFALKPTAPDIPPGARILRGQKLPTQPYLVKVGRSEFLQPMFSDGLIRVAPASLYADPSLNNAIQDNELSQHSFLRLGHPGLHVLRRDERNRERLMSVRDLTVRVDVSLPRDFFVLCLAHKYDYRLVDDFDADAVIFIQAPDKFLKRVAKQATKKLDGIRAKTGNINYYDPFFVDPRALGNGMNKHFRYAYQNEFRMLWRPPITAEPLSPFFIRIGPMRDFASYFVLAR